MRACVCVYVYECVCLRVFLPACLSACLCVSLSLCQSVCVSGCVLTVVFSDRSDCRGTEDYCGAETPGACVYSPHLSAYACRCPTGFTGTHCDSQYTLQFLSWFISCLLA